MNKQEYNGWTNYETWLVNLWLTSNDQETVNYWNEQARLALYHANKSFNDFLVQAKWDLADQIREELEYGMPIGKDGMYTDLMRASLYEVNYNEIALSLIDGIKDTTEVK